MPTDAEKIVKAIEGLTEAVKGQTAMMGKLVKYSSRQADALVSLAQSSAPKAPNWRRPLAERETFDWAAIGADVLSTDDDGVAEVDWGGYVWKRRSGSNKKFGKAVWFSRTEVDEQTNEPKYMRLVTFKDFEEVEPLSEETKEKVRSAFPKRPVKYDVFKDERLTVEKLVTPSATTKLEDVVFDPTLYFRVADLFRVDRRASVGKLSEMGGDVRKALIELDRLVPANPE